MASATMQAPEPPSPPPPPPPARIARLAKSNFFWTLAVIFAAALALQYAIEPIALPFWTFTAADVSRILTPLVLIALFIERALEVFITSSRQLGADQLAQPLARETAKETKDLSLIEKLEADCMAYTAETRKIAFIASLFLGFITAAVGVRCIEPFVQVTAFERGHSDALHLGNGQLSWFNAVDILLTAALLAGGAEAIHKIMNVFNEYADSAANNAGKLKQT